MLNIASLLISLRNPDIYSEQCYFENDITLTEQGLWEIINKPCQSNEECIVRLNDAINKGIAHYWGDNVEKYNLRIPFYENYLLFLATSTYSFLTKYIPPFQKLFEKFREPSNVLKKYEFSDYKKAIERGVGFCSQHAIIISQVLKKKGINSKIVYLKGHIVATAQVNTSEDTWWVLDSDYGVIVKHDIQTIEQQPDTIAQYYQEKGYSDQVIKDLIRIYSKEGNKIYDDVSEYHGRERFYKYYVEYILYTLKWLIPLSLLLLSSWLLRLRMTSLN
jgi:hypothetical protein